MNTRLREMAMTDIRRIPTDEELAILADDLYAGQLLDPQSIHVRTMLLCHDQYDRTYERFPREMLKRFQVTLPGKSVLACHDTGGGYGGGGTLPLGRFFTTQLRARTEQAFPVLKRGRPRRAARAAMSTPDAAPPGFELESTRVTYLEAGFYFPNHDSTEGLRVHLDTGVYKWVSVGFRYSDIMCDVCGNSYLDYMNCPHLLGRYDEETGKLVTATYGGDMEFTEALEGSLVYLGGQPRARMVKSMVDDGQVDPERLAATPYGTDLVAMKEAEDLARHYGHARRIFTGADLGTKTDTSEAAPVGLSLADEALHVLACVGGFVDRALEAREQRAAKGKQLGQQTMGTMRELRSALDGMLTVCADDDRDAAGDNEGQVVADGEFTAEQLRAAADALVADAYAGGVELGLPVI